MSGFFAFPDRAARALVPGEPASPPENLHHQKMCAIIWCSTAAPEKADQATKAMRSVGQPALDHVEPMPFPALQSLCGGFYPPGLQWYWRADFFKEISDASIAPHLKYAEQLPIGHSTMHMYPINGAAQRVGYSDTAFSYRDALLAAVIVGVDPRSQQQREDHQFGPKEYFDALHPHSSGGAYVNFMMKEGQERVKTSFRGSYDRLATIQEEVQPHEFLPREPEY